jgi:hypothetical protein
VSLANLITSPFFRGGTLSKDLIWLEADVGQLQHRQKFIFERTPAMVRGLIVDVMADPIKLR